EQGHIKLTDFGLSKESIFDDESKTYSFCGTVEYMAPEVVNRKGHGTASDWWSYGVLMFEMLTGQLPFQGPIGKIQCSRFSRLSSGCLSFCRRTRKACLGRCLSAIPANRLGFGAHGMAELKAHPFFASLPWTELLNRRFQPPFKPADETFYFDNEFTNKTPKDSPECRRLLRRTSCSGDSLTWPRCCCSRLSSRLETPLLPLATPRPAGGAAATAGVDAAAASAVNPGVRAAKNVSRLPGRPAGGNSFKITSSKKQLGVGSFAICHRCAASAAATGASFASCQRSSTVPSGTLKRRWKSCCDSPSTPNIVSLRDVYTSVSTGRVYLVMELLRGGELLDRILRQKFFSEREASAVIEVVCRTLAFLHKNGVVHRDLKPSNPGVRQRRLGTERACGDRTHDSNAPPTLARLWLSGTAGVRTSGFAKQLRAENAPPDDACYRQRLLSWLLRCSILQGYVKSLRRLSAGVLLYTDAGRPHSVRSHWPNDPCRREVLSRTESGDAVVLPRCGTVDYGVRARQGELRLRVDGFLVVELAHTTCCLCVV
uniref:Protein kinase domain-containing protein n=1 Tax=Macrostomum lignano TaxID=282301 RepID=A0A1I8FGB5_9PLAT